MSMPVDFDIKERVKQATDIVELVGSYLQLRRQGAMFVASCPWHDDRRPSLQINPVRQTWTCWVCDIRGDVFNFVMKREGVEFRDALKILADRAGIAFTPGGRKVVKGSPDDKQTLFKAMQWAMELYHHCLLEDPDAELARRYLRERQITSQSIERFKLGFAPLTNNWLVDHSRTTHFSPEILAACDLVAAREWSSSYFERFQGRLLFPIFDTLNRPIAFGGRLVPGVFPKGQEPPGKYVNSKETKLFSKSDNLYGLNIASDESSKTRQLTVVEGYTDVIGVRQAGVTGVVAALGTAINQRHIKLLKRYADRVTLLLDGDTAGQKRANEVLDHFVSESLDLRILTLPDGQDPFDFVQQHRGVDLQKMIDSAPDALEHKIRAVTAGIDLTNDTHASNRAIENILQTLALTPTAVTSTSSQLRLEQLLARLSRQFMVDREQLKQRLLEMRRNAARLNQPPEDIQKKNNAKAPKLDSAESELIELVLLDPTTIDEILESVHSDEFSAGPLRKIYELINEAFHDSREVSFEALLLTLEDDVLKDLLIRLDDQAGHKQNETGFDLRWQLNCVLLEFDRRRSELGKTQLINQLQQKDMDAQQEEVALVELLEAMRQRKGISAPTDG